jgi:hypothetical protein
MKFDIGDEVYRREAPHKTRTWNREEFLVKVG